jgi:hypothetical protein
MVMASIQTTFPAFVGTFESELVLVVKRAALFPQCTTQKCWTGSNPRFGSVSKSRDLRLQCHKPIPSMQSAFLRLGRFRRASSKPSGLNHYRPPPLAEPQKPAPEPMIATLERIPPEPPKPPTGSLEQQKVWLDTWALENPFKSVAKTTETIKTTFGLCLLSPSYIAGVIKVARELYEDQHKAVAPPSPAPISQRPRDMMELAMAMQEMGIKKIELIDGAVRVEMGPNT